MESIHLRLTVCSSTATTLPLVSSVCSKTSQPPYCNLCLNSFNNGKAESVRQIAGLTLSCLTAQCVTIRSILSHYANSTHFKEFGKCGVIYNAVTNALSSASDSFRQNNLDNMDAYLEAADNTHLVCSNLFLKAKRFIPSDLATEFYTFRMYDRIARDAVHQL